jgi:homoserine kinase
MKKNRVSVFAPASLSNLGSGFDVLGVALEHPGDIAEAVRTKVPGLEFKLIARDPRVPAEASKNVAAHVAALLLRDRKAKFGVELRLQKKLQIGSGLGSSAASGVAALVAVNALLEKPLGKRDLLTFAIEGERLASGTAHADNVSPCLFGGATIVRSYHPLDVVRVPVQNRITWGVALPDVVVLTKDARAVLPQNIPLKDAVQQWGNLAGLIQGLILGDVQLIGKCVEDVIIEPHRARLIPGFHEAKKAALKAGAYGVSISGSGPAVFAVCKGAFEGRRVAKAMADAFKKKAGVSSKIYVSRTNMQGATVL